jgi:hypothetical protein
MMAAKDRILGNVVDHDGFVALPDLVADGGFDLKFPAGHQAELDFVSHGTADPPLLGDACYRGETHAGRAAYHFQNARNRCDTLHGGNIRAEVGSHHQPLNVS